MTNLLMQGVGMTSLRTRERLIQRLRDQGVTNMKVLDVMLNTPRHIFLDEALAHRAYEDTALPIGHGQTISQPYIVARMTEILLGAAGNGKLTKVLEVGTGSGYQTSILAQLIPTVYSVERIKPLQDKARERFRQLGLRNIQLRHADGGFGWPEAGPYDGILSTAAPQAVPEDLLGQLAPGGVLVIPIGGREQQLNLIIRDSETDKFVTRQLEPVKFVPFLSGTSR
jgi:protein-L-isoaspartate(D-aspartate) O-methyltransferase